MMLAAGLFMQPLAYLGQVDVGDDDDVDSAGRVAGALAGVATRVVAVLALGRTGLPGHALLGDADLGLGGGLCGTGACVLGRKVHKSAVLLHPLGLSRGGRVVGVWNVVSWLVLKPWRDHQQCVGGVGGLTEVETGTAEGEDHDASENLCGR